MQIHPPCYSTSAHNASPTLAGNSPPSGACSALFRPSRFPGSTGDGIKNTHVDSVYLPPNWDYSVGVKSLRSFSLLNVKNGPDSMVEMEFLKVSGFKNEGQVPSNWCSYPGVGDEYKEGRTGVDSRRNPIAPMFFPYKFLRNRTTAVRWVRTSEDF
ncbi:hypothetical protein BP00DRAFT_415886 [Aspergillus indologenus CBS 114.80]|uniref:Uncharacterized protein n=1 Tax=Aspergillus indologenus CBS 114.80 TaxID=1450541 RepID=A0A2V5IAM0_9EURO|nr:hypothetical protein BP00DRAFT_415886 [Aspergillus indologenus CBS 114.80]